MRSHNWMVASPELFRGPCRSPSAKTWLNHEQWMDRESSGEREIISRVYAEGRTMDIANNAAVVQHNITRMVVELDHHCTRRTNSASNVAGDFGCTGEPMDVPDERETKEVVGFKTAARLCPPSIWQTSQFGIYIKPLGSHSHRGT
jgi:hypothetical protein